MKTLRIRPLEIFCAAVFLSVCGIALAANAPIPSISGGIGPCSADFTVTDGAKKPLYDAKIDVVIHYGFLNLRKTELEVGTNSDGKARFTGLPEFINKPLTFHVKSGTVMKAVTDDTSTTCNATYTVMLTVH